MKIHIVQKGDTLWKIAKKYGVDFEELKKMNAQLSNPDMIMPGMKIKVPSKGSTMKKEVPHKKEMPIKEAPKKEKPVETKKPMTVPKPPKPPKPPKIEKIEAPKQPYTIYQPVMPQPTQGIDINNYYMMNLSQKQAQIQQQVPQKEEKPIETPPKYEEESPPSPEMPMMPMPEPAPPAMPLQPMMPIQGGCPPLYPNYCYPVMPMHSICDPCYPYPMPGMMPYYSMPMPGMMPYYSMPMYEMYGVPPQEHMPAVMPSSMSPTATHHWDDESSSSSSSYHGHHHHGHHHHGHHHHGGHPHMYGGEHWSEGQGAMMHTQHQSSLYPPLPMRETYVGGYPTASGLSPTQEGMQSVSPSGIPSYTDQPLPGTVPPYAMPYRYEEDEGDDE